MKKIAVEQLPKPFPRVLQSVAREPIAITRAGKVYAAFVALDELDYEAYSLGRNPKFADIIQRSRESGRLHGLVSLESLEKELGLPRRRQRVVRRAKPAHRK
jgi:antitoxin (DNA-binding transcriptional repressor) of toxin-antitoxin stability system